MIIKKINEKKLIKEILKGNTSSFNYFVDTYQDMALTIAYKLVNNNQEAEDIVQNAFVKAYNNLRTYQFNSKFSTWFYRIVYNTALTAYKKLENRKEIYTLNNLSEYSVSTASVMEQLETESQNERVGNAVQQLSNIEGVIVTLYYLEEYSITEIAEIMSLTKSNVKMKLFRARKQLQEILK